MIYHNYQTCKFLICKRVDDRVWMNMQIKTELNCPQAAVLVVGAACTFYSALGGIKAVLATDVFQGGGGIMNP